ncbi:MAG TPA: hypothetical protein VN089_03530, partial [Duganella sp.]|nr:hypothetical protein [Duganella sp.]
LLPLLGDADEARLQGATGDLARLPVTFNPCDEMVQLPDLHVAAMSLASLSLSLKPEGDKSDE